MSSTSPLDLFPVASIVELHGLLSAPQHNGRQGMVVGAAASQRLSVQLEGSEAEPAPATGGALLLSVKPSNARNVPEKSVSFTLKLMRSFLISNMIKELQVKMGTDEFDAAAHDALCRQQAKFYKNGAKASAHDRQLFVADACAAGKRRRHLRLCQPHRCRLRPTRHAPSARSAAKFPPQARCV